MAIKNPFTIQAGQSTGFQLPNTASNYGGGSSVRPVAPLKLDPLQQYLKNIGSVNYNPSQLYQSRPISLAYPTGGQPLGTVTPDNQQQILSTNRDNTPQQMGAVSIGNSMSGGTSSLTSGYINQNNSIDYASLINAALTQNGQDAFGLNQQPTDKLQQILDTLQKTMSNQRSVPNYADIIQQSRIQNGIPQLQQQLADTTSQFNQADTALRESPMLLGQLTGHEANLANLRQSTLANQLNQLGIAQGNVGQDITGATTQGSQQLTQQQQQNTFGLGLGALAGQAALNPSQVALQQAQAQQAQAQAGFYQNIYGSLNGGAGVDVQGNQIQQTGNINQLPAFLQGATTTDINGQGYIVEGRVPNLNGLGADAAKSYAGKLGVPILNDAQAGSITALDTTQNNLKDLQSKIGNLLGSGLGGRIQGMTLNNIEKMLGVGNGPSLTQIDSFRESAIKQIQGLASGQSGLRLNQAEIDSAIKNLPTSQDNIETANAKMQQLGVFFQHQRDAIYALGGLKSSVANMKATQDSVGWGF